MEPDTASATPEIATSLSFRASVWLQTSQQGHAQKWSATPARSGTRPAATGAWMAVLDPPSDPEPVPGALQSLDIADQHFLVRWNDRPEPDTGGREARFFETPIIPDQIRQSGWLRAALDQCSRSPQQRWRARLALGSEYARAYRADDQGTAKQPDPYLPPSDLLSDPVLEASALQVEGAWRYGLMRLGSEDADLARRTAARLCAVVDFGSGVLVPAWPSEADCASLLHALLEEGPGPQERARAATDWLQTHSSPVARVTDDSGATDLLTKRPIATIEVANLSNQPAAALVPREVGAGTPDIISVPSMSTRDIPAPLSSSSARTGHLTRSDLEPLAAATVAREGQAVTIQVGDARFTRRVLAAPLPVIPPGIPVGPLLPDLSMQEWLELGPDAAVVRPLDQARAALLGNGWLTAGLLYRRDARPSEAGAPPVPEWTLYIELSAPGTVRQAQASGDQPAGFLRLWLGPFNAPTDILRINADGSVVQQAGPNPQPAPSIRIANEEGHWACWMPVPAAAVEADGSIRIAVERVDSRGVRSAWPRAMLPWQREPGRAVLTTRSWGGVMGSN